MLINLINFQIIISNTIILIFKTIKNKDEIIKFYCRTYE